MGWFGRDPDKCNEDVRRQVARDARRGEHGPYLEPRVFSRKENWHTQRDQDLDPNWKDPDF